MLLKTLINVINIFQVLPSINRATKMLLIEGIHMKHTKDILSDAKTILRNIPIW